MKKLILTAALSLLFAAPVSQANAHDYHAPTNHHGQKYKNGKHEKYDYKQSYKHEQQRHANNNKKYSHNKRYNQNFVIQKHYIEKRHGSYCAHLHQKPQYSQHYGHNHNQQRDKNLFEIIFKLN